MFTGILMHIRMRMHMYIHMQLACTYAYAHAYAYAYAFAYAYESASSYAYAYSYRWLVPKRNKAGHVRCDLHIRQAIGPGFVRSRSLSLLPFHRPWLQRNG